jgi:endonuclease/exonuclease/phosphatase family metal-dependent hydrolase
MAQGKEEVKAFATIFANVAGGARGNTCRPQELASRIATQLKGLPRVVAIGLSEAIISTKPGSQEIGDVSKPDQSGTVEWPLNDLIDFERGFGAVGALVQRRYVAVLDSGKHTHEEAVRRKWNGEKSAERIREQYGDGNRVYQGTAGLLLAHDGFAGFTCAGAEGIRLRPEGEDPLFKREDDPNAYRGNRDTEPRSALVFRGVTWKDGPTIDLCFCHLETHTTDQRTGTWAELEAPPGTDHRLRQVDLLCQKLARDEAKDGTLLLGDFNVRPGSKELARLCAYGFRYVLPEECSRYSVDASTTGRLKREAHRVLRTANVGDVYAPDPSKSDKVQGWPYTHLGHGILIDHAFVKGVKKEDWRCELRVLVLPDEETDPVSDHRPIVLTLSRASR